MEQLEEITETLHQAHNAQDGLKKLIDLYEASKDTEQMNNTLVEVEESEFKNLKNLVLIRKNCLIYCESWMRKNWQIINLNPFFLITL